MRDLNFFHNNLDLVRSRLATRGFTLDAGSFNGLDRRGQIVTENETLKAKRNQAAPEIGKLPKEGVDTSELQRGIRAMAERNAQLHEEVNKVDAEFRDFLARLPNLPQAEVPVGESEHDNRYSRSRAGR